MSGPPVDLPSLDEEVVRMPDDIRRDIGRFAAGHLYYFDKAVLGYKDMTEDCHGPLCTFFDENTKRFKMALYPRGHLKSHVITIGRSLQKVARNPEERILLGNETMTNAEHFLSSIKAHVESNKIFRALYSHIIPKDIRKVRWSSQELEFVRQGIYPDPTITAIGMTGAYTSRHFTHLVFDDPISEEAAKSMTVMEDVINRISKLMSLMVDPDHNSADLVGTRWAFYDVYAYWEMWLKEQLARVIRGALEDGKPIWPERFSVETLALIRDNPHMGEYNFSCQYMNNPRNAKLQDFNVNDLKFWRWSDDEEHVVLYSAEGKAERAVALDNLDVTMTVDVRYGEGLSSDRDAVTVVGTTIEGDAIVLHTWADRANPLIVIDEMIKCVRRFRPRCVGVAKVGYETSIKYHFNAALEREGLYANVVYVKPGGPGKPHIRGLQPVAATGHLYILPTQHQLRTELSEYPLGQFDDVADSLALHLQLFQGLLSQDRLDRYKASEQRLLRRIVDYGKTGPVKGDPDFDLEDYDDEEFRYGPQQSSTLN